MLLPNFKPQLTHMLSHERLVHKYTTHDLPHGQIMQKFVVKFVILALNNNKKNLVKNSKKESGFPLLLFFFLVLSTNLGFNYLLN